MRQVGSQYFNDVTLAHPLVLDRRTVLVSYFHILLIPFFGRLDFIALFVAFHVYYRVFAMRLDGHFKKKLWRSLEPKYNPQRAIIDNEIATLGKYHGSSVT